MFSRIARSTTVLACAVFLASAVLEVALMIASDAQLVPAMPDRVDGFLLWAPFVVAVCSLVAFAVAYLRKEPSAFAVKAWFTSGLIVAFYAFAYVWFSFFPLTVT